MSNNRPRAGMLDAFWRWYERHYELNLVLTAMLFMLQLVHLYWLTTHVVLHQLLGVSYFNPPPFWQLLIICVDYSEIPALISTSVLYFFQLRQKFRWRHVAFLIMLNSQWLHLFWITDTFVVNQFSGEQATILPLWLAWVAILIDYLELPVMAETFVKAFAVVLRVFRTFRAKGR